MHSHCEIVIPPTHDVESAVMSVMSEYDENNEDQRSFAFWDWYVIGGRWAGCKLMSKFDAKKLGQFTEWLDSEKLTISGLVWGKQELNPRDQIERVDAKWNEMFPSDGGAIAACPIFKHSNPNGEMIDGDICRVSEMKSDYKCSRILFSGPSYDQETDGYTGQLKSTFMLSEDFWNGTNHVRTIWDLTFKHALNLFQESIEHTSDAYKSAVSIQDDWLVVTVDSHS